MVERLNLIASDKIARNWLRKNTRLEDAFTGDKSVKSLILIAATTAIITSRRNEATIEFSYSIAISMTIKLSTTDQAS